MTTASLGLPSRLKRSVADADVIVRPELAVVEGVEGVRSLETAWRALADGSRGGAFLGFGFALAAARYHEERGERVVVATVDCAGRAACILPMAVARRGGVRVASLLGDPLVQYGDALMAAGAPAHLPELAAQKLADRSDIDVFSFRRVRGDAIMRDALDRRARAVGQTTLAPFADLTVGQTADEALAAIGGSKQKRERQRSRRRLAERGEVRFGARRGPDAIPWLREAFALKRVRLAEGGHASPVIDDPRTVVAFERAALDLADGGDVVATKLTVADAPAAYEVGIVRGRRYHAYLGVVAAPFANHGPGKVVMEDTVRWCCAEGIEAFDLLPPFDDYKRFWTNGAVEVRDYVEAASIVGALYAGPWLRTVRPRLRSALQRLPTPLRRHIGAAALRAGMA